MIKPLGCSVATLQTMKPTRSKAKGWGRLRSSRIFSNSCSVILKRIRIIAVPEDARPEFGLVGVLDSHYSKTTYAKPDLESDGSSSLFPFLELAGIKISVSY